MTSAKDMAANLITRLEEDGYDDAIIPLDDLENGEFVYLDTDDNTVYLVTVAEAKIVVLGDEAGVD